MGSVGGSQFPGSEWDPGRWEELDLDPSLQMDADVIIGYHPSPFGRDQHLGRQEWRRARAPSASSRRSSPPGTADRHVLYEESVQSPDADVRFFERIYKKTYGERPSLLREDFCGTAALCCEWVKRRGLNRAIGIDLDAPTLAWSRKHNLSQLGKDADRVKLIRGDVLNASRPRAQVVASLNFSYFIFKTRPLLLGYFRTVRESLKKRGIFVLDIMGGPDAQVPQFEETDYGKFTYVWDQDSFNPITHDFKCHIHFKFPSGSKIRKAFTYDWRLWSVAEVKDLLLEAGFRKAHVYWEGSGPDGEGDGIFRKSLKGDDSPAWIAYIVGTP